MNLMHIDVLTVRYNREDFGARGKAQWFGGKVRRTQHAVQSLLQNSKYAYNTFIISHTFGISFSNWSKLNVFFWRICIPALG